MDYFLKPAKDIANEKAIISINNDFDFISSKKKTNKNSKLNHITNTISNFFSRIKNSFLFKSKKR